MPGSVRMVAAAIAVVWVSACESPFETIAETGSRNLVHAVIDLGADSQTVMVERTRPDGSDRAVRGAAVTVTTPEGHVIVATGHPNDKVPQGRPALYQFRMSDQPVSLVPGGVYTLRIVTVDGDTITGTTTVPAAAAASIADSSSFNRATDTLRLDWPRVPGAKGYQVIVRAEGRFEGFAFLESRYSVFTDTTVRIPGDGRTIGGDHIFPRGTTASVVVLAVDDNYYTYYRPAVDPFAGAPASRLGGGALGVFGSVVSVVVRQFDVR